MLKPSRFLCGILLLTLPGAPSARASVLLSLAGGYLKDQGTTRDAYGSGTLVLVASTGDAAFTPLSSSSNLTVGSAIAAGSDDIVIGKSTISGDGNSNGAGDAGEFRQAFSVNVAAAQAAGTVAVGDALQLYWLPSVPSASASLAAGTSYGAYRSAASPGNTDADGSSAWYLPANGTSGYNLLFLTSDAGSAVNTAASGLPYGQASLTAVPEPSCLSLLGLTAATAAGFLRRRASIR